MKLNTLPLIALFQGFAVWGAAQTVFPTGCSFEQSAHEKTPRNAPQLTRNFVTTPPKASLKSFCPKPRNQAPYNTCVGWATAYGGFSILNAMASGSEYGPNAVLQDEDAFSPSYVYNQISGNNDCMTPAFVHEALELLIEQGCARLNQFPFDCETQVDDKMRSTAAMYNKLISGYKALVPYPELKLTMNDLVKKSVSEGNPVVCVIKCYDSFMKTGKDGIWSGVEDRYYGYHALTLVGYDNDVNGGSFEVMNSWGTAWANGGFAWIKYSDFERVCSGAYELTKSLETKAPKAQATAAVASEDDGFNTHLSGTLKFIKDSGEEMIAGFNSSNNTYSMRRSYRSGTRFQVVLTSEPSFVYILGTDATGKVGKLFPHKEGVSALLSYKENQMALPAENAYVKMDNTVGKDYLVVLYSLRPIKIDALRAAIENDKSDDSFPDKVRKALGERYLPEDKISYNAQKMSFEARAKEMSVIALMVETDHVK